MWGDVWRPEPILRVCIEAGHILIMVKKDGEKRFERTLRDS